MKEYIIATVLACTWLVPELRFVTVLILFNIAAFLFIRYRKLNSTTEQMKSKKYLVVRPGK